MERGVKRKIFLEVLVVLLLLCAATALIGATDADRRLSRLFFSPQDLFYLKKAQPWQFLYDYANVPAIAITVLSFLVLGAAFFRDNLRRHRKTAAYFILVLALGPGFVVHTIFKDHWGRPRPRETIEFGGDMPYLHPWQKGVPDRNGSFPSGHAAVAFYLMTPFFVLRRRSPAWGYAWLGLGLAAGSVVGFTRIVQGGHYLSDILWSGGFTYFTGLGLAEAMGVEQAADRGGEALSAGPAAAGG